MSFSSKEEADVNKWKAGQVEKKRGRKEPEKKARKNIPAVIWFGAKRKWRTDRCHEDELAFTEACLNSSRPQFELVRRNIETNCMHPKQRGGILKRICEIEETHKKKKTHSIALRVCVFVFMCEKVIACGWVSVDARWRLSYAEISTQNTTRHLQRG